MNVCRRFAGLLAGLALLLLGTASAAGDGARPPIVYDVTVAGLEHYGDADRSPMTPATVTRHVDGDTFEVAIADPPWGMRTTEKVRFMGIDTPELNEPFGAEALEHVQRRAGSGPVYLAFDFQRRDRFGRLLAFVYLRPDDTLLNAELIEAGLARLYRGDDLMYFFAHFERLETEVRRRCLGIWEDDCGAGVVIVTIRNDGRDEHVLLRNYGSAPVDISGWQTWDDDGDVIMIPAGPSLAPGETVAVCSGTGCVGSPEPFLYPLTVNIWGNPGDLACLKDRSGALVDSYGYGKQAADTCAS